MPLPILSKTWNYNVNNTYLPLADFSTTHRRLWYSIKNLFVTNGLWSVIMSSNGTTASVADNWTSSGALGTQSWIVLKHPANNSQLLIQVTTDSGGSPSYVLFFSKYGWNTASAFSTSVLPSTTISGDVIRFPITNQAIPWGTSNIQCVHHYMWSSDGYCHRHIVYASDFPVLGLFLETPENPVTGWSSSGLPSFAMFFNSGSVASAITINNTYRRFTNNSIVTRIDPVGSVGAANADIWLSGEAITNGSGGNSLIVEAITAPNDLSGEYPMVDTGIVLPTYPYATKLGKPFDLWYGISNLVGSVTYPNDNSRQFAQHGCLITPWNGSVMLTR